MQCSKPAATKAEMGRTRPTILSVTERPAPVARSAPATEAGADLEGARARTTVAGPERAARPEARVRVSGITACALRDASTRRFDGIPGTCNAITDVPGVEVGYATLIRGEGPLVVGEGPVRTGVTAIHPRGRADPGTPCAAGFFSLNGNGEMTGTVWIEEAGHSCCP